MTEVAKGRKHYREAWEEHVKSCFALALVKDEDLSKEVLETVDKLMGLIPKVAKLKTKFKGYGGD